MGKRKQKEKFESFRTPYKNQFKTIKTLLKTVIKDSSILPNLNKIVLDTNDLVIHTYRFIRLYLLFLYKNNSEFPVINERFILYCIKTLGDKTNCGPKGKDSILIKKLEDFYKNEYQPLLNHIKTDIVNKSRLLDYIAIQINTSITTNIQQYFMQHLSRFINITTKDITQDKNVIFEFKKQLFGLEETNKIFDSWCNKYIEYIFPYDIKTSVQYDVKVRPIEYLKGMIYMNSVLENTILENNTVPKLFQTIPLRTNIIPKHITIDTTALVYLFCPINQQKSILLKNITENQELVWGSFLKTESKIFKNKHYQFYNQIQTDGISCSLLFIRKDLVGKKWGTKVQQISEQEFHNIEDLDKEQLDVLKDRNIIGCDPGKRSLVYMVDQYGNKLQYTSPQRRRETKSKCNQRILLKEKNKHNIHLFETELLENNSKTVDYEKFKLYLVKKDKLNKNTRKFYEKDIWRKMSFRTYSYGQKSIDKFLNKISEIFGPKENIIIGYGNWSRTTSMKYYEPTINKGLRKLIHKKYDTITINEHKTSCKCCECYKDLEYHIDSDGKKIYRLLKCSDCVSSVNKKIVFRTRDVNSAVNIRTILSSWIEKQERPKFFCRSYT